MKHSLKHVLGAMVFCFLQFIVHAQPATQTAMPGVSINSICHGFYIYTPQGYASSGSQKYPLLIAMHGVGEDGNGTTDLPRLLGTGMPALIKSGNFPTSFTVSGHTYSFLVISPQFVSNPGDVDILDVMNYAIQNYRVDPNRIYLTGYSQGGGNIWYYAGINNTDALKVAAMVVVCGSVQLQTNWAQNIASSHLPIWATHNSSDPTIPVSWTTGNIDLLNNSNPPLTPSPKMTIFNATGHDAWTHTYDPNFTDNGMNVYQWMLQFQRNISTPLPVTLISYKAVASNNTVTISWTTGSEINNHYFVVERSSDGNTFYPLDTIAGANISTGSAYNYTDNNPFTGNNFYRLYQVDNDGHGTYFDILKVTLSLQRSTSIRISPNPAATSILLELNNAETGNIQAIITDMRGSIVKTFGFNKQSPALRQLLDISTLAPGSYVLELRGVTTKEVQKFIKQ